MQRRMLMLSVPLGKAERVVQLANEAGATGATILHCREMLPNPGAFQLEPQRDLVVIVINADLQTEIEANIQKGFDEVLGFYCLPILDSVGLDAGLPIAR